MRRLSLWILVGSVGVAGCEVAHLLAFRLVYPDRLQRAHALQATGYGYLRYSLLVFAAAAALGLIAFVFRVSHARRREPLVTVGIWGALAPAATFVLLDQAESFVSGGSLPFDAAGDPTFLPGLLLQVPLGLAAYLLVRFLIRSADKLGRALACRPRQRVRRASSDLPPSLDDGAPCMQVPALRHPGRAPPRLAPAR
jgi:hypothetical protein